MTISKNICSVRKDLGANVSVVLNLVCNFKMLNINMKKAKVMIFVRTPRERDSLNIKVIHVFNNKKELNIPKCVFNNI